MSEDGNANGWRISGHKTYKQLAVSFPQEFVKKTQLLSSSEKNILYTVD